MSVFYTKKTKGKIFFLRLSKLSIFKILNFQFLKQVLMLRAEGMPIFKECDFVKTVRSISGYEGESTQVSHKSEII